MRATYRVDFKRTKALDEATGDGRLVDVWVRETRFKTRGQAEFSAEGWRRRGYDARVVVER